jgi:predicted nucleotide-binding protein
MMKKEEAIAKLNELIGQIDLLKTKSKRSPDFIRWKRDVEIAITYIFGDGTRHIVDFKEIRYSLGSFSSNTPSSAFEEAFRRGLDNARVILESMISEIQQYWNEEKVTKSNKSVDTQEIISKNVVFIVHGHDELMKKDVQLLLSRAYLYDVVLHECPDKGRTIIDKLIDESSIAGYVIALLSPDDKMGDGEKRARQNVILEIGYFLGKLGKDRVRLLRKGNVEIPSDLQGILYENYDDNGAWKIKLLKEMKAVGIDFDLDKVIKKL